MKTFEEVQKLFAYEHLPAHLQIDSKPFYDVAVEIFTAHGPSAEMTLALRKLWEAKNLVVWASANATIPESRDD